MPFCRIVTFKTKTLNNFLGYPLGATTLTTPKFSIMTLIIAALSNTTEAGLLNKSSGLAPA